MARRRGRALGGGARGFGNWVVGGNQLSSVGAATSGVSWGNTVLTPTVTAPKSWVLVSCADYDPGSSGPSVAMVGELEVDAVEGSVSFNVVTGSVLIGVAVGIYVSPQLVSAASAISVRDPAAAGDAQRDDYLFLRGFALQGNTSSVLDTPITIPVSISRPVLVPSGHALIMSVGVSGTSASVSSMAFVRAHIRRAS